MTDEVTTSQEGIPYRDYLDERKLLIAAEQEAVRSFDKAMMTLAGGGLVLSVTFVADIAPQPRGHFLLYGAWICFVFVLIITLISFRVSHLAWRKQLSNLERYYQDNRQSRVQYNMWGGCTEILNWTSIPLLILGVVFLLIFSAVNLP